MSMIFRLLLLLAMILAAGLSPAQAQNGGAPHEVALSPTMLQARKAFQRGDYTAAAALMRGAAQRGDALAQVGLGQLYLEGRGVPKNPLEGFRLLKGVVLRHQEPSYSLAISALQHLGPLHNSSPEDVDFAMRLLDAAGRRPPSPPGGSTSFPSPVLLCTGYICF